MSCRDLVSYQAYLQSKYFPRSEYQNIIANLAIYSDNRAPLSNTVFPKALEIDYIRFYENATCEGVKTISNRADANMSSSNYNYILGTEVYLQDSVDIFSGEQLALIAEANITISPGVSISTRSDFIARASPTDCSARRGGRQSVQDITSLENSKGNYLGALDEAIRDVEVYPNPTIHSIFIQTPTHNAPEGVSIFNAYGQKVVSARLVNGFATVDMSHLPKGVYLLYFIQEDGQFTNGFRRIVKL